GLIFYLHGNTGAMQRWAHMGQELSEFGFDVFVMDYRGFGQSTGPRKEAWMHRDCIEVYRQLLNEVGGKYEQIVVYGRSLGSGFAVPLSVEVKPDKLVLETPFKSLLHVAGHHAKFLPLKVLLRYHMRNDLLIDRLQCAVLVFHGTKDKIVPFSSAFELFQIVPEEVENRFVSIPDGKHNNLSTYPVFRETLKAFLLN
ncbi:MAG: alpha/beta hydrolase, partial [Flavobacteriales bacterium]